MASCPCTTPKHGIHDYDILRLMSELNTSYEIVIYGFNHDYMIEVLHD